MIMQKIQCPFCGGEAEIILNAHAVCPYCARELPANETEAQMQLQSMPLDEFLQQEPPEPEQPVQPLQQFQQITPDAPLMQQENAVRFSDAAEFARNEAAGKRKWGVTILLSMLLQTLTCGLTFYLSEKDSDTMLLFFFAWILALFVGTGVIAGTRPERLNGRPVKPSSPVALYLILLPLLGLITFLFGALGGILLAGG